MAIFKCKMCGGTLEIGSETVATCEYCGTQQTLPKLDDDRRANLYDRANHFRRNNEFDKAIGIYEQILTEDKDDAEAYWSLVLCRYGIEYVEDPATHKRIPTVNRAQFTAVFDDDNYKSALQYADNAQRAIYEAEAKAINEIQKGILAISQAEKPFDVFICYKETDKNGRRTPDSVLATELYHELTKEGYKVFFSRITLEDKLGSAYEPYIFAALNSAKVMVVLGTQKEHFNAVWVKNEWSRYLALIKQGQKKMLIPAYRDMDPYDLPEEFSHLQAQDMAKLGFMQDLVRGIQKIVQADVQKTTTITETVIAGGANTAPLLKRVFMFLDDGDWSAANEYCEKVLDIDPECAEAYLGKLMAELKVKKQNDLKNCAEPFDSTNNYQKVLRFSGEKIKTELASYIDYIKARNEKAYMNGIYIRANNIISTANTESAYKEAAHLFESIIEYQDSATLATECYKKAETARKDAIYQRALMLADSNYEFDIKKAIPLFESISGWLDADERKAQCPSLAENARKDAIYKSTCASIDLDAVYPAQKPKLMHIKVYEAAIEKFKSIENWKDSGEKIEYCRKKIAEVVEQQRQAEIDRKEAEKEAARLATRRRLIIAITIPLVCVLIGVLVLTINNNVQKKEQARKDQLALSPPDIFAGYELGDPLYDDFEDLASNSIGELHGQLWGQSHNNSGTIDELYWVSSNSNVNSQDVVDTARERIIQYFEDRYGAGKNVTVPDGVIPYKDGTQTATQFVTKAGLVYLVGPNSKYNIYVVQVKEPY